MNNIDIQLLSEKETNKPCIIKFPCGLPPKHFVESVPEFSSFSKKLNNNKRSRVILSSTDQLEYESDSLSINNEQAFKDSFLPPSQSSKFAMGIFDRNTNELVFIPTEIYDMKQSVKGYRLTLEKNFTNLSKEERLHEVKKLASDFGSRITKEKMKKMEMEDVNNLDFDKTNKSVIKNQNILADKTSEEKPLDLPAFNKEANKEIDAYPIEDIFPPKVYFKLDPQPFIDIINGTSTFDSTKYPEYFQPILDNLTGSEKAISKDDIEHSCKILSFMHFTILMLKKKSIAELDKNGIHYDVKQYLTTLFANRVAKKEKIIFIDDNYNKIYNYLVILSLHLEGFVARNVSLLAKALSLGLTTIEKHYYRVGCKIHKRIGENKSFSLSTPLAFPEFKRKYK